MHPSCHRCCSNLPLPALLPPATPLQESSPRLYVACKRPAQSSYVGAAVDELTEVGGDGARPVGVKRRKGARACLQEQAAADVLVQAQALAVVGVEFLRCGWWGVLLVGAPPQVLRIVSQPALPCRRYGPPPQAPTSSTPNLSRPS